MVKLQSQVDMTFIQWTQGMLPVGVLECISLASGTTVGGLYKLHPVDLSFVVVSGLRNKPPSFIQPLKLPLKLCNVISWVQTIAFKWVNLYRYTSAYLRLSLSFVQMLKAFEPVVLNFLIVAMGLEAFSLRLFACIVVVGAAHVDSP